VTVIRGRVIDVVVDLRHGSASFGRWSGFELSDNRPRQLYMPAGFAQGFCVLSEFAELRYKVSQLHDRDDETGLIWNDKDLDICWPIVNPIVSARDSDYPALQPLTRSRLPKVALPS